MKDNCPYETQREFWIAIYNIFRANVDKFDLKSNPCENPFISILLIEYAYLFETQVL